MPIIVALPEDQLPYLIPPLDIAYAWLVHRLNPTVYKADIKRLSSGIDKIPSPGLDVLKYSTILPGPFAFSDGIRGYFSSHLSTTLTLWHAQVSKDLINVHAVEPFFPPKPYKTLQAEQASQAFVSHLRLNIPSAMLRQASFLHSLLRPCYLERPFLEVAVSRYYYR